MVSSMLTHGLLDCFDAFHLSGSLLVLILFDSASMLFSTCSTALIVCLVLFLLLGFSIVCFLYLTPHIFCFRSFMCI